jgi:hypothetical protein
MQKSYNFIFVENLNTMSSLSLFPDQMGTPSNAVIQVQNVLKPQSKEYQAFNKLTKRIDSLKNKINFETTKLDGLLTLYHKEVFPKVLELGNLKIKLCKLLHEKRKAISLSKKQNEKLDEVIIDLLDDAFSVIEPAEATKQMYNAYTGGDFDEESKEEEEDLKHSFAEMFYQKFGLKFDPSLLDENPDFGKIEEHLKQQVEENKNNQKPKKKTKKQMEKEALEQQKEELKKKSLRSIYLSLAKLLHPDTEQDENLRLEKEEIMKKVTTAYDKKDMMELLKIEMQWVKAHEQSLHKTDVNTLVVYTQLLKDQLQQLEFELDMVYNNPKYADVREYHTGDDAKSNFVLMLAARDYTSKNETIASYITSLEQTKVPTKPIKQCIEFYYSPANDFLDFNTW